MATFGGATINSANIADLAVTTAKLAAGAVTEAKQTLADNTTGNVSTSAHGYVPKATGSTTTFLNANGAYSSAAKAAFSMSYYVTDTATSAFYLPLQGFGSDLNQPIGQVQIIMPFAATFKNGYVRVDVNTKASDTTCVLQKDEVDTALSITITGSATGIFSDTSNTVAYTADDRANWEINPGGAGNLRIQTIGVEYDG